MAGDASDGLHPHLFVTSSGTSPCAPRELSVHLAPNPALRTVVDTIRVPRHEHVASNVPTTVLITSPSPSILDTDTAVHEFPFIMVTANPSSWRNHSSSLAHTAQARDGRCPFPFLDCRSLRCMELFPGGKPFSGKKHEEDESPRR